MKSMEGDACIFITCCFIGALQFKLASRLSPSHITLLPVITCRIYGQNGFQKQNITLLDSGAQISLIREETAVTLGLKGNESAVTKVGGEEETIRTKVFKVPVSLSDNAETFSITVIGIPGISEEVSAVQFKPIGKLLGLENQRIRRVKGPIDLLIDRKSVV